MKIDYYLGPDAAKHKVRVALRGSAERLLLERDLRVSGTARRELLALLALHVPASASVLVLIELINILRQVNPVATDCDEATTNHYSDNESHDSN